MFITILAVKKETRTNRKGKKSEKERKEEIFFCPIVEEASCNEAKWKVI